MSEAALQEPFGHADVETERTILKSKYPEVYLADTSFSSTALAPDVYLIIGRRGTGKSALAAYFAFQKQVPNVLHVPVGENDVYPQVLSALSANLSKSAAVTIPLLMRMWHWAIVVAISEAAGIARSERPSPQKRGREDAFTAALNVINDLLQRGQDCDVRALDGILDPDTTLSPELVAFARRRPLILTLDTLEKYDTRDTAMMQAMAALIQYAAQFQLAYSPFISFKVFIPGEIYNHLLDTIVMNPVKAIRRPLSLTWSAPQLTQLIAWRFWQHLRMQRPFFRNAKHVQWRDAKEVYRNVWSQRFCQIVNTPFGAENSLSYILRHTQMRPRQLIYACNCIAARAALRGSMTFSETDIVTGVEASLNFLVSDVINAYGYSVPRLPEILESLSSAPPILTYAELQQRAGWSREAWSESSFSIAGYVRLLVDVGVLGRVVETDGMGHRVCAEFAQSANTILGGRGDTFAIHPMFHHRLNVNRSKLRVDPFDPEKDAFEQMVKR